MPCLVGEARTNQGEGLEEQADEQSGASAVDACDGGGDGRDEESLTD